MKCHEKMGRKHCQSPWVHQEAWQAMLNQRWRYCWRFYNLGSGHVLQTLPNVVPWTASADFMQLFPSASSASHAYTHVSIDICYVGAETCAMEIVFYQDSCARLWEFQNIFCSQQKRNLASIASSGGQKIRSRWPFRVSILSHIARYWWNHPRSLWHLASLNIQTWPQARRTATRSGQTYLYCLLVWSQGVLTSLGCPACSKLGCKTLLCGVGCRDTRKSGPLLRVDWQVPTWDWRIVKCSCRGNTHQRPWDCIWKPAFRFCQNAIWEGGKDMRFRSYGCYRARIHNQDTHICAWDCPCTWPEDDENEMQKETWHGISL